MNRGGWIQTFTGRQFFPLDPRPEDICIEDIAHALSMQCRYAGHVRRFYSVAEHSCRVATHAKGAELWGLLHDASEAYLVDVPRPIKPHLAGYQDAERKVMAAICERFGLWPDEPPIVKEIDTRILMDERAQLLGPTPADWSVEVEPLGVTLDCWPPSQAKGNFLWLFDWYGGRP